MRVNKDLMLSEEEFVQIKNYIYENTGLFFDRDKREYLERRLLVRMGQIDINSFMEYYYYLKYDNNGELRKLAELITTNETYFYRNLPQLDTFSYHVLPELLKRKASNMDFTLNIWSAGCSTGEEPYTLAMILKERIEYLRDWSINIVGTDISERVLNIAEKGVYFPRSLMDTPTEINKKYFLYNEKYNTYILKEEIKNMVDLRFLNLIDESKMCRMKNMDVIFCRNVLIYFDETSRRKVIEWFYDALKPGGYIFLGHSESLLRINKAFEVMRMGDDIVYRKAL